jgi:hypothetical protein
LDCGYSFVAERYQLRRSDWSQENPGIVTVSEPALLLPTGKGRSPKTYFFGNFCRDRVPIAVAPHRQRIDELYVELKVSAAISDAPGTQRVVKISFTVNWADINPAAPLPAARAEFLRGTIEPVSTGLRWYWKIGSSMLSVTLPSDN